MEIFSEFCNICYNRDTHSLQNITVNEIHLNYMLFSFIGYDLTPDCTFIYLCKTCTNQLKYIHEFRKKCVGSLVHFRRSFFDLKTKLESKNDADMKNKLQAFIEARISKKCSTFEDTQTQFTTSDISEETFDLKEFCSDYETPTSNSDGFVRKIKEEIDHFNEEKTDVFENNSGLVLQRCDNFKCELEFNEKLHSEVDIGDEFCENLEISAIEQYPKTGCSSSDGRKEQNFRNLTGSFANEGPSTSKCYIKYCLVPHCTNTSFRTPEKIFISIPSGVKQVKRRKLWLKAMRRREQDISANTKGYVCGDHFNLEEDMVNFIKWKLVGGNIFIKENITPHIFKCQEDLENPHAYVRKKLRKDLSDEEDNKD